MKINDSQFQKTEKITASNNANEEKKWESKTFFPPWHGFRIEGTKNWFEHLWVPRTQLPSAESHARSHWYAMSRNRIFKFPHQDQFRMLRARSFGAGRRRKSAAVWGRRTSKLSIARSHCNSHHLGAINHKKNAQSAPPAHPYINWRSRIT